MRLNDLKLLHRMREQVRVLQSGYQCLAHGQSLKSDKSKKKVTKGGHYGRLAHCCKPLRGRSADDLESAYNPPP
jgi:hypothetical protein